METKLNAPPHCWRCGGTGHYAGICPDAMRQSGPVNERGLDAMTGPNESGLAQDPNLAAYQKQQMVRDAAPALLEALKGMLELPDIIGGECRHCGRQYNDDDDTQLTYCPADDCPGHISRAAIAKVEGRE